MTNQTHNIQDAQQITTGVAVSPNTLPTVIQIDTIQSLFGLLAMILAVGIAWGTLKTSLSAVSRTLKDEIAPDLKNVRERFMVVEDRVETLWKDKFAPAHSPRQLNERGGALLNTSGIKEIVEKNRDKLLEVARNKGVENPYDAEKSMLDAVSEIPTHCPEVMDALKRGAYAAGADLDAVFLVGGIHLRNLLFPTLGFSVSDLDKPKT